MQDAYKGLFAMEKQNVVNTDIKPGNLMVMGDLVTDADIQSGRTYLAIADHDLIQQAHAARPVNIAGIIHTRGYLAPELMANNAVITNKSSLWQISLSFYETAFNHSIPFLDERDTSDIARYFTSDDPAVRLKAYARWELFYKRMKKNIDMKIITEKVSGNQAEVDALINLKKLILNGFQLDPEKREFFPKDATLAKRKIIPGSIRPSIEKTSLVRKSNEINHYKVKRMFAVNGEVRRGCEVSSIITATETHLSIK